MELKTKVFKNKRTGQVSLTLPKKQISKELFNKLCLKNNVKIKLESLK